MIIIVCVCVCVCVCVLCDRGCVDQVFCLRALMEKAHEFHTPLYLCFIDLTKAYDSVSRSALWNVLRPIHTVIINVT